MILNNFDFFYNDLKSIIHFSIYIFIHFIYFIHSPYTLDFTSGLIFSVRALKTQGRYSDILTKYIFFDYTFGEILNFWGIFSHLRDFYDLFTIDCNHWYAIILTKSFYTFDNLADFVPFIHISSFIRLVFWSFFYCDSFTNHEIMK